jgi:hypothetical protein
MNTMHLKLQALEDSYIESLNHITDQEEWAKAHGYPLLAKALVHGSTLLLSELAVIQKLIIESKS